ncbi:hypothetical protein B0H10DRAFT_2030649 [Mycena sp. CBHHK59/15]|nr:hypothetical protein B0H10DRAFT_2030649 [Mycena sp. CBHHK59/15]
MFLAHELNTLRKTQPLSRCSSPKPSHSSASPSSPPTPSRRPPRAKCSPSPRGPSTPPAPSATAWSLPLRRATPPSLAARRPPSGTCSSPSAFTQWHMPLTEAFLQPLPLRQQAAFRALHGDRRGGHRRAHVPELLRRRLHLHSGVSRAFLCADCLTRLCLISGTSSARAPRRSLSRGRTRRPSATLPYSPSAFSKRIPVLTVMSMS